MKKKTLTEALVYSSTITNKGITFSGTDDFFSYQSLYNKALLRLFYFQEIGNTKAGDKLIFQFDDNYEFVVSFWACIMGGIIPIPLTYANTHDIIVKLWNVWNIVGQSKIIMPGKLLKKIRKQKDSAIGQLKGSFSHFQQCTLCIEDVSNWEIENPNKMGTAAAVKPDDLAFIQFSSGSTGDPKGVMLSHNNIITNIYDISKSAHWTDEDKSLSWMPLTHDMGLIGLHITPLVLQCDQHLMSTFLFAFYPLTWMEKVHEHRITITACPNFGYEHFINYFKNEQSPNLDFSSLRIILNGAEPISYKVCKNFISELTPYNLPKTAILPVYGLAEGTLAITNNPIGETILTHQIERNSLSMGRKIVNVENTEETDFTTLVDLGTPVGQVNIDIRDSSGNTLPEETVGLVFIKGENVTKGYFNNPEANKKAFAEDSWFNTGDLGFIKNNRLTLIGRQKEILFINGQNYYANDIERVAHEVEEVEMGKIGVCGIENNDTGGDELFVFVQYKKDLEQFVKCAYEIKSIITSYTGLTVKQVVPVKKMPVTTSGKVKRFVLKTKYLNGNYDTVISELKKIEPQTEDNTAIPSYDETQNKFEQIILEKWYENAGQSLQIGLHDNFFEAGGSSLLITKVASSLRKKYQENISVTDFFSYPTVAKLAYTLKRRITGDQEYLPAVEIPLSILNLYNKTSYIWNVNIRKDCLDLILDNQQDINYLEHLLLTCYALVIGKISNQKEITIYLAQNAQDTFLSSSTDISQYSGYFQLMSALQAQINQSTSDQNIKIEKSQIKEKQHKQNHLHFMLTRDTHAKLHSHIISNIFDCIINFRYEKDLELSFSFSGALKKEVARSIADSFVSVIYKLAENARTTVE